VGVVLSDRTGSLQAFYHKGDMASADLIRFLKRCAEPNRNVRTTETINSSMQTSMYLDPAQGGNPSSVGYYAPAYGSMGFTNSPYGYYGGAPMFTGGGSCPTCRRY
jgi:hypothetical protein